ncbi:ras-related protein Rab-37-like isoform X2 [Vespula pensylvanica]|uniref:ras-related protein Rab-37-like isoform X2 n=1 Tax=Vespula pensylvanica TaxID=30213 RepID=UPI001CBA2714|nr:ras-related protein Rab-37-like isoform X2 [Vespula pensylvanica]XP_043686768.1 ras-related protein Rab-37-like isoform X2 [Vespula pensylvanica]XP_050869149.1 ras-related protein Rab-37-like isoform X2 [Vespula vulgaris]XP_050869150.1 ras-related protein Rab-37-like isoform X2 [Vespula vulgaris]
MTGEGSVNDNVFDMEVNGSSRLTPVAAEQRSATAPSPTGYRDYKPPAEVLSNSYSTTFHTSGGFDSARANFKRDQEKEEDFAHKTILLGDSGVGKTSLLVQFDTGNFQPGNFAATVGIGFTNKIVTVDETRVKLQIWDTAGQERFRSVTHAYYRDAHALLLLYDVTNKTSFDNIRAWLSEIREHANEDVVIMLLGNKSDCGQERVVKKEDGERLAQEYKVPFMETSAKTGLNVELAFLAVARELKARKSSDPDDTKFNVQDYVRQQSKRNSCFNSNCLTT